MVVNSTIWPSFKIVKEMGLGKYWIGGDIVTEVSSKGCVDASVKNVIMPFHMFIFGFCDINDTADVEDELLVANGC